MCTGSMSGVHTAPMSGVRTARMSGVRSRGTFAPLLRDGGWFARQTDAVPKASATQADAIPKHRPHTWMRSIHCAKNFRICASPIVICRLFRMYSSLCLCISAVFSSRRMVFSSNNCLRTSSASFCLSTAYIKAKSRRRTPQTAFVTETGRDQTASSKVPGYASDTKPSAAQDAQRPHVSHSRPADVCVLPSL